MPSSATLYCPDEQGNIKKYVKLSKPANLLITSVRDNTYEVYYEGQNEADSYNPETGTVDASYLLKTLYINPAYIVEIRENEEIAQKHASGSLVENLSKDIGFSKIVVSSGGSWVKTYDVVGYPKQLLASLKEGE